MLNKTLLRTRNLQVHYPILKGIFRKAISRVCAVDGVSLEVREGEFVSLVGESGCGKSSLALAVLGLTKVNGGEIELDDKKIDLNQSSSFKKYRRDFQIIFQDPYSALNPRHTIFEILAEPLLFHGLSTRKQVKEKVASCLEKVGLSVNQMHRYPHAFSGGQRQRICIARVIALQPRLVICDEIVSALDLSVQAQIVHLLLTLKKELNLSLLWISHDLSLVRNISDRVYVMYLGKVVEHGDCEALFSHPNHPYTDALLAAIPVLDRKQKPRLLLSNESSSPTTIARGCSFHPRCTFVQEKCKQETPVLNQGKKTQFSCFFPLK